MGSTQLCLLYGDYCRSKTKSLCFSNSCLTAGWRSKLFDQKYAACSYTRESSCMCEVIMKHVPVPVVEEKSQRLRLLRYSFDAEFYCIWWMVLNSTSHSKLGDKSCLPLWPDLVLCLQSAASWWNIRWSGKWTNGERAWNYTERRRFIRMLCFHAARKRIKRIKTCQFCERAV